VFSKQNTLIQTLSKVKLSRGTTPFAASTTEGKIFPNKTRKYKLFKPSIFGLHLQTFTTRLAWPFKQLRCLPEDVTKMGRSSNINILVSRLSSLLSSRTNIFQNGVYFKDFYTHASKAIIRYSIRFEPWS
jgi:hypothetical protein